MRPRGNGGRNGGGNRRMVNPKVQTFDSNGPDVRVRGTAYQISDKYLSLAKDAASVGDRILAESYLQHAEHYQRFIAEMTERFEQFKQFQRDKAKPENGSDSVEIDDDIEIDMDIDELSDSECAADDAETVSEEAKDTEEVEVQSKEPVVVKTRAPRKSKDQNLEAVSVEA